MKAKAPAPKFKDLKARKNPKGGETTAPTTNTGSQAGNSGAGKVTFTPFSITR
jgi:hypothetical protein